MLSGIKSRLYLERRRLAFVAGLAFLAGFFMYLRSDLHISGVHIAWVTGGIYAGVVGGCAVVVCLFLPSMRFMIEAVAVSRLILSLAILAVPGVGTLVLSDPLVTASVIVLGGMALSRAMHGRILKDRPSGWRARLVPATGMARVPVRIDARPWQASYVGWMDDMRPVYA